MKLPNYEQAIVPEAKITEYLLSSTHPRGKSKATFFMRFGFLSTDWQLLANALLSHVANYEVCNVEPNPLGMNYTIEGPLSAPDGREPLIRSVWFIATDEDKPTLATAYPLKRRKKTI